MAKKSIVKGANFERYVAEKLSLWASKGQDKYVFHRRSGSGGAKRDKIGSTDFTGDIYADKELGRSLTNIISFELKFYQELTGDVFYLATGKITNKIRSFILQAEDDAKIHNRKFFLILKANLRPSIVITNCGDSIIPFFAYYDICFGEMHTVDKNRQRFSYLAFNFDDLLETDYKRAVNFLTYGNKNKA